MSRAWAELDLDALAHNTALLCGRLPQGCALMGAVKADAYGHGAEQIAHALQDLGVEEFCVASAGEGVALRRAGVRGRILVLGWTAPEELELLREYGLAQTVVDLDYARQLDACGPVAVHVGLDTGMHRLGLDWRDEAGIRALLRMRNLRVEGVFTHLCDADGETLDFTRRQGARFWTAVAALEGAGLPRPRTHLLNSTGILRCPELGGDCARAGIALYGTLTTPQATDRWGAGLRPVLSLKARVASVREVTDGEGAGYGLAYTARGRRRLAAVTIGYADGLPRSLSCGAGCALLHGAEAPVAGRVCMDQTLLDVTAIPGVRAGDTAVFLGTSGARTLRACDVAQRAGTITNELLSRIGARVERRWERAVFAPGGET